MTIQAEVAFIYKWPPSEIGKLTVPQLMRWHEAGRELVDAAKMI